MKKQLKFITYALFIAASLCMNLKTHCLEKSKQTAQNYLKISQILLKLLNKLPAITESSLTRVARVIDGIRTKPVLSLRQCVEIFLIYNPLFERIAPNNCRFSVSFVRWLAADLLFYTAYSTVLEKLKTEFPLLDIDNLLKQYNLGERKPIILGNYLFESQT